MENKNLKIAVLLGGPMDGYIIKMDNPKEKAVYRIKREHHLQAGIDAEGELKTLMRPMYEFRAESNRNVLRFVGMQHDKKENL